MSPDEKQRHGDDLHLACRKLRLAISRLDGDVPDDESTGALLVQAQEIIERVRFSLTKVAT